MRINHNISSMTTTSTLYKSNKELGKSLEKLSTGLRINRSSDDAAGLAISENLRTQIRGAAQAQRNAMDGTSMLQVAEGAANEISDVLQRMRELSIQSSNDTLTSTERNYANQEFGQLRNEVDRIANVTNYNGKELLSNTAGRFGTTGATSNNVYWIDAGSTVGTDSMTISIDTLTTLALNANLAVASIASQTGAADAISSIDAAINSVNSTRATIGAFVNRLEHAINNLLVSETNQSAAESLIRDVDFANESANFSKNQILMQSGTAMLAQANSSSQNVLSLLR
jgi:flagellin